MITVIIEILAFFLEAGDDFEICLEPEPKNQKKTGSGNAAFNSYSFRLLPSYNIVKVSNNYYIIIFTCTVLGISSFTIYSTVL